MLPYYLLIIIPFYHEIVATMLLPNQFGFVAKKNCNNSIILFFVLWFILLSLRHISCGIDLVAYEYDYFNVSQLKFLDVFKYHDGVDSLYFVYNWILAHIYTDFRLVIIITAFLCTAVTGWYYWKESEIFVLTLLLFVTNACYQMFYSGLRQSIAMLFVVPAYYFVKEKKFFQFIVIVFLARYFHQSAFIMLLLYPIYHIPLRSKYFVLVMLLVALFFLMKVQIFNMIVPFLSEKWSGSVAKEASGYSVWAFFILLLIYSFIVCDERKMNYEISGLRNVLVLMTLIQGFAPIHTLAMRMNYYFIMLFPIIIPKLINRPKDGLENVAQLTKWILVLFLFLFYLFGVCNMDRNALHFFPYKVFWE